MAELPNIGLRETLLIGGPRHGETVQLLVGNRTYTDLKSATSYTLQTFARPVMGPLGVPSGAKAHDVLVMDGLLGGRTFAEQQARKQQVQTLIADVIVGRWFMESGYDVSIQSPGGGTAPNGHKEVSGNVDQQ